MKNIANIITSVRIPLSLSLLPCYKHYFAFFIIYLLCGISDVLDGYIARKTKTESTIGSKLDSFADFIMFMVIIAVLCMWSWNELLHYVSFIILIFIIRIINIFIIRFKFHQWGAIHTIGNKCIGLLVYTVPLFYIFVEDLYFLWIILAASILVSLEETYIIMKMRKLNLNRKSFLFNN